MTEPPAPAPTDSKPSAATPRWVKLFVAFAIVLVLIVAAALILGGGEHGPGRHLDSDSESSSAPVGSDNSGHTVPAGIDHGPPQP
jgi:hypothetical protein